jgi:3-dehydroquinate synthase
MRFHELEVELGERAYPVIAGPGLLGHEELLRERIADRDLLLVSDHNVAPLYAAMVRDALGDRNLVELVLPAGEQHKTLEAVGRIFDGLAQARMGRDAVLIALGGGVIGDLTGFAAACWQRGIDFVQLPTTLLAQVDASVGGKTAVNHPMGKNLIGAFHQPRLVIADSSTLASLPQREYRSGLGEVIKHAMIADATLFNWLEAHGDLLLARDPDTLAEVIIACCRIKAAIVVEDEHERGRRAVLNFGHTFGHAIEGATGYGLWRHGEAVTAGMLMAVDLSTRLGRCPPEVLERLRALCGRLGLPVRPPRLEAGVWREWIARDKKTVGGRPRFVLLEDIGKAVPGIEVPARELDALLAGYST